MEGCLDVLDFCSLRQNFPIPKMAMCWCSILQENQKVISQYSNYTAKQSIWTYPQFGNDFKVYLLRKHLELTILLCSASKPKNRRTEKKTLIFTLYQLADTKCAKL